MNRAPLVFLIGMFFAALAGVARAQTPPVLTTQPIAFSVLHGFTGASDGASPAAGLIKGTDGRLYGTTQVHGAIGYGTIFAVNTDGTGFTTLYNFTGGSDGGNLNVGLIQGSDGRLYGTSTDFGSNGYGTVFALKTDGTRFTTLYSFTGGSDGGNPYACVVQGNDGRLYGVANSGGLPAPMQGPSGYGTVFAMKTDGTGFTTLYSFTGNLDGGLPNSLIQGSDCRLYGTTLNGGTTSGGTNGGGDFYSGGGVVFALKTDGSCFTTLYNFTLNPSGPYDTTPNGASPTNLIQGIDGRLYGATQGGGPFGYAYQGYGVVYAMKTDGSNFTLLHSFTNGNDGADPTDATLLQGSDGRLYGTTMGGNYGGGVEAIGPTVYSLNTDGTGFCTLYVFQDGTFAPNLEGALVQGSDGQLYGTTYLNKNGTPLGTVFSMGSTDLDLGDNVTYGVTADGDTPFSYQWQLGGVNISGATGATLTLSNLSPSNSGLYDVIVCNSAGSVTSNAVSLTVDYVTISQQPGNQTVLLANTAMFSVVANGFPAPIYQWQESTNGGGTWTNLADGSIFTGSGTPNLSIAGAARNLNGSQFRCVVTNVSGAATSSPATLTVDYSPGITLQSGSETVIAGQAAGFSVGVCGSPAPSDQWQVSTNGGGTWANLSDGAGFSGTNTATLAILAATGAMSGEQFRMAATNTQGTATSTPATLTVTPLPEGSEVAYNFITWAGSTPGGTDGMGSAARFNIPRGVALDSAGNVYVADADNGTVRMMNSAGIVTTLAGTAGQFGSTNGMGSAARFNNPTDVAVDGSGNVYVADSNNNSIRKIAPGGEVSTLAGGTRGGANGAGSNAQFSIPMGVAVDEAGNVYVADSDNNAIRKIDSSGNVTTIAGGGAAGYSDGTGTAARFWNPQGLAVDGAGNVFVTDTVNSVIRKVTPAGVVTTLAGSAGNIGNADGNGNAALFNQPVGIAVDAEDNVYVADSPNDAIRMITSTGAVSTLASGLGEADGTGSAAQFDHPYGVAVDSAGDLYIADSFNDEIRKMTLSLGVPTVVTVAGQSGWGSADGTGSAAQFFLPSGTAVDSAGNVYVADSNNDTIREITPTGAVSTLAGTARQNGSTDGTGSTARFFAPSGVAVDSRGNVYVADSNNDTIRKITPAGIVTTPAGTPGQGGSADGTGGAALFNGPCGVAVDAAGTVYVADTFNCTIRRVTATGVVTTLAGAAGQNGSADGTGSAARFNQPRGVAVNGAGNIYVADTFSNTIRMVTPAGVVTTLAGMAGQGGSADGTGSAAQFFLPSGVAVDGAGNIYVADLFNVTIRKITPAGVVTTLAGTVFQTGSTDGVGNAALFFGPFGIAVDDASNIYLADSDNNTIRKGIPTVVVPAGIATQPQNVTINAGQSTTFQIVATGAAPLSYQWQTESQGSSGWTNLADGGAFSGSATATLSIADAAGALNGAQFQCVVSNAYGSTTSSSATLMVNYLSGINLQSGNETVIVGQSASFSVGVSGSPAPTYRWQVSTNGGGTWSNLTDGSGFNSTGTPTLEITAATAAISGDQFQAVVTNAAGSVTSVPATLTVNPLPTGDVIAYSFITIAGTPPGSMDGTGNLARFYGPSGGAVDSGGNLYIADSDNNTIREISPSGVVITLAGTAGVSGSTDGQGSAAQFSAPNAVAVDSANNVYVADFGNNTVRKISPTGAVTTLAGTAGVAGSADGTGAAAQFNGPSGVAVDDSGNVYVGDSNNNTIRMITPGGVVNTLAGMAGVAGSYDGTGAAAQFSYPAGLAIDGSGNLYVADTNNCTIREILPGGIVSTLAGTAGVYGYSDGTGAAAQFINPADVAVDGSGDVYVTDTGNNTVRKIALGSVVTTIAGTAQYTGSIDGVGGAAEFNSPDGIAVNSAGIIYVADGVNDTIRSITSAGAVTTLAGSASTGSADGAGASALFSSPHGMAVDSTGNVYIADSNNNTVRKITPGGIVSTLAGTAGFGGSSDGTGAAAQFGGPFGAAVDVNGNVYVADKYNSTIRKITPGGVVTTLAGTAGVSGSADGTGAAAQFMVPHDVAVDTSGNVYVVGIADNTVRKITPSGVVTTLAGSPGPGGQGSADGTGPAAQFEGPSGVAVDGMGNVFVADSGNCTIRKITQAGVVTTLAGTAGVAGSADGTGAAAQFNSPDYLAVDAAGNLYTGDASNCEIRKITSGGVVTTLAGQPGVLGSLDGIGTAARFNFPTGIAVDGAGNLYVGDAGGNTIREGIPMTVIPVGIATQPQSAAISAGQNAAFGVAANGAAPFSYQWQIQALGSDTWTNLTGGGVFMGAASPTLSIIGATGTLNGAQFQCVVSNGATTATSNTATLTVSFLSGIELQSGGETVIAGQGASFSVGVGGNAAPSYQWQESTNGGGTWTNLADGNGVSGSATATLEIGAVTTSMSGYDFRVIASNGSGMVTSTPMTLTVAPAPSQDVLSYNITTLAGNTVGGSVDGPGGSAEFSGPSGLAVDSAGYVYVADWDDNVIRKITPSGVVTTLAGTAGVSGSSDGTGASAQFILPSCIAVDATGNLYVVDNGNNTVRKITPAGVVTTLAGTAGVIGSADGTGAAAQFNEASDNPAGIAVDGADNVYVSDFNNDTIRRITPAGVVTTLAGNPGQPGFANGTGRAALFASPQGVAVDAAGNVFITDPQNEMIRKITPGGVVTTVAGNGPNSYGFADGTGSAVMFGVPNGLALDPDGNILVADSANAVVRKVTQAGVVTTVAGAPGQYGFADGIGSAARFGYLTGIAVGGNGALYIADGWGNNAIRMGTPIELAAPEISSISPSTTASGGGDLTLTVNGSGFDANDTVLWTDGTPLQTSYSSATVLTAVVPSSDLVTTEDVTTALVSVQNLAGDISNSAAVSIVAPDVSNVQATVAPPGGAASASTAPTVAGNGGATATLQNNLANGQPAAISAANYSSNPTSVPTIDVGGQYVDVQVTSVTAADKATVYFYYPSTVTGANAANLQLLYFDGSAWQPVLSSGGSVPVKNPSPNLDGTVSGGRFTVVFDGTSTPAITALTGTVITPSIVTIPPTILSIAPSPAYLTPPNNQMVPVTISVAATDQFYPSPVSTIVSVTSNEPSSGPPEWVITGPLTLNLQASRTAGGSGRIYTITIQTTDTAGNVSTGQTEVIVPKNANALNNPPVIVTQPQGQTVNQGATVSFSVATAAALPVTYQWLFNGTPIPAATGTMLILDGVTLANAGDYTVNATNANGTTSSKKAVLKVNAPPSFTTQPQSQAVAAGASVTFTAAASGGPKPKYQWFLNGVSITGGKSGTLKINKVKTRDAGTYTVVASNTFGSVTSNPAILTVDSPPQIMVQPKSQTVIPGANATFTVVAVGNPTLGYQWFDDGNPVIGATSDTLSLTDVQSSEAGAYTVTVTNFAGDVSSHSANLKVKANVH